MLAATPIGATEVTDVEAETAPESARSAPKKSEPSSVAPGKLEKESIPSYWANHIGAKNDDDLKFDVLLYLDAEKHAIFDELLKTTYTAKATQDRLCPFNKKEHKNTPGGCPCVQPDGNPGLPIEYRTRRVMRVEDAEMWDRYLRKREEIRLHRHGAEIRPLDPPVDTLGVCSKYPDVFSPLDANVHEVYLWHGTYVRSGLSIAQDDFRIDLAGDNRGTMYGRGAYFGESSTKADEYCRDEPDGYYQGVFVMLLCRAVLGKYYYTSTRDEEAGNKVLTGKFDSTVGDRRKSAHTFREFVLYNSDQVYPEYMVLYQRVHKADDKNELERMLKLPYHMELPVYWSNFHKNPHTDCFDEQYPVHRRTHNALQNLVVASMKGCSKLERVKRVENSKIWLTYNGFKQTLRKRLAGDAKPGDIETGLKDTSGLPPDFQEKNEEHFNAGMFYGCCCCTLCFWIPVVFFVGAGNIRENCPWTFMSTWMRVFSMVVVTINFVFFCGLHYFFKFSKGMCWSMKDWCVLVPSLVIFSMSTFGLNHQSGVNAHDENCAESGGGVQPAQAHETITYGICFVNGMWFLMSFCAALKCEGDQSAISFLASQRPKIALFEQNMKCVPAEELMGDGESGQVTTAKHLEHLQVEGVMDEAISIENLEGNLNEHFLWHGTTKDAAEAIVHNDFRIPKGSQVSHGSRFGNGAYFAEDLDKSLSYAKDENGVKFVLLCRVTCGQFYYTEKHEETTAHEQAEKNQLDCVLANPGKAGPREFIILSADQVYPEFILEISSAEEFQSSRSCHSLSP